MPALTRNAAALAASKAAKATKAKAAEDTPDFSAESPTSEAPQINLLQTGRDAMTLAGEAYPYYLDLNRRYGADYARNEVDVAEARSAAEAAAIGRQGLGLREKLLGASPEITAANQSVLARLQETGPSALEQEANRQALRDLKLEGAMSPEDVRAAVQQSRAGASARGLAGGTSSLIAEVLGRQQFSDARRDQRRGYASAVDSQTTQRRATDAATSNNAFNTLGAFWDPQQRMFGRSGSQVSGQTTGPSAFSPYLGAGVNVAQSNLNASTDTNRLNQEAYQFDIGRQDSAYYSALNMANGNANAAAARKSATTSAAVGAGASILAYAAMAFL